MHMCRSASVGDVHHFLFDCPAYTHIKGAFAALFQGCPHTVASLINGNNPTVFYCSGKVLQDLLLT